MAKRVGLVFFLVVGFLAGSVLPVNVSAAGTGTQSDPFIVHELTMDARFVSQGAGTLSVNGGGIGSSNYGNKLETDNINLNDGENTISISSDFGCDYCEYFCDVDDCGDCNRCDDCGFSIWNDHVLAVFRIGSDTDGNVIYTQRNGWSVPGGGTINEAPASSCYFWSGSGQTTVDFPWTSNEKCVNTLPSGFADCAYLSLSKTFYVQYIPPCVCSSGPCCDGCNYRPSGSNCGTAACHSDYYYQSGGSCYKADYPTSCTKTCDGSGNCQDCCIPVNSLQTWDCGICRQRNPSSCSGSTGPLCENSPPGTLCNSDSNSCTNDICYSGACTHPAFCSGTDTSCGCTSCSNCNSQDRYYDTSPLNTSWVSTGECTEKEQKQQVYRDYFCSGGTSCVYTTGNIQWIDIGNIRNKADGAQCTTLSGQPGTCSTGTCIPKPTFSVSANLYPSSINVDESTTLSGAVTCLNGDCGSVTVYPKSDQGTSTPPLDAIPGLNVQCNTGIPNCGFSCHTMTLGSSCTPPPSWTITGKNAGTYSMFLRVMSTDSNVLSKDSSTINLNVNEIPFGSISITSFSPDSPVITKDSSTIVRTEITCSGTAAKCGNITLSLSYSPGVGLTVIPGSTSCMELKGGKTCPANWTILGNTLGAYNLYVSAHSDILEVADVMKQIVLTVTDKPVIQISNVNLITPIKKGETAALSAEIKCISSSASCGTVKSSLKHNGTAGSLTIQNPEKNCGIMYASSNPCIVSSGITGNAAGTYAIEIVAYSDSLEVQNASVTRVLYVSKNLGNLSVPEVKVIPSIINKSSSATLSATVNCAGYCGSVNVNLKVGGVLLNSMTFLSTTDQNPQSCASFPCYLSWNLTGNSVGPFDITVNATSNESLYAINYTNLQVIDPDNPSLGIFSNLGLIMKSAPNQAVPITANVKCFTKDCGQTTVTLSYNNGAGWIDIGSSGIVHSQSQNPVALGNMKVGDSNDLSWGIAFLTEAVYQLRITANGTALNLKNGESTGTINVSQGVLFIDIRNPVEGQSFSLGDVIPLKAMITSGGLPVSTLSPIVTSELFGYAGIYYFPNDGTYTGNASVPSKKVGNYQLVFMAEDSQSNVNIYINPELSVTLKTDKYSYAWDDKIEISGDVKKNGKGAPADITINLASGKWNDVIKLRMGTGSYSHVYENRMPKEGGRLMLEVIAKDDYGNIGNQSAEVGVSAYTGDSYDLSFDMGRNSYNRGDNMTIFVRVSEMNVPKSGLRVNCTLLGADIGLLEGENGYYGNYAIPPNAELGNNSLSCSVAGPKPGQGYETITVEPMPLKITIIDPEPSRYRDTDIISAAPEEPIKLKVSVHYPDGKPVTDATVEIMLGGDKTNMTQTEPGNYIADVRFTKLGGGIAMSTIFLTAQDSQGNQGKSNVGLVVGTGDFNWWWLLLIPAGLAILFVIYIYMKSKEEAPPPQIQIQEKIIKLPTVERVREIIYRPVRMPAPAKPRVDPVMKLKDEIDRLEEKSRTTQDAKDLAEQQYYKRQIDESTFNKLMQSYEEKLIEIDAGIRQKKKELYEIEPE